MQQFVRMAGPVRGIVLVMLALSAGVAMADGLPPAPTTSLGRVRLWDQDPDGSWLPGALFDTAHECEKARLKVERMLARFCGRWRRRISSAAGAA